MIFTKHWLLNELTEDELLMAFAIAKHESSFDHFDLDTIQAMRMDRFARKFQQVYSLVIEEFKPVIESLKTKIMEFEKMNIS